MRAQEIGNRGPLSRRGFLRKVSDCSAAAVAAAAIQLQGCCHHTEPSGGKVGEGMIPGGPGDIPLDRCFEAVKHFREVNAVEYNKEPHFIHAVQMLITRKKKLYIEVLYEGDEEPSFPSPFNYSYKGAPMPPADVFVHDRPILKPHARPGGTCKHSAMNGTGTIGWNIAFNGVPVCLTAYHLVCGPNYSANAGEAVLIDGVNQGQVYKYTVVDWTGRLNIYELGMASYNPDPGSGGKTWSEAETIFRLCADGTRYLPSPIALPTVTPQLLRKYHKVGCGSSICGTGLLRGGGDRGVKYDANHRAQFTNQMLFDPMADLGDSGSLMMRDADTLEDPTAAVGIYHTGDSTVSVACPLYTQDWKLQTPSFSVGPRTLPTFTGTLRQAYGG